jgi:hypothetical protein
MTRHEDFLISESALDRLLNGFADGTWPHGQWTHGTHLAVGGCYVREHGLAAAIDLLRQRIPRYNAAHGFSNGLESGYHETLTVFWATIIDDFLSTRAGDTRLGVICGLVSEYSTSRDLTRFYYSFDVVHSREARVRWIAPDLKWLRER